MKTVRTLLLPLALAAAVGAAALDSASAQDKKGKDKDKKPSVSATAVFEVYKDTADEFRFRLKDAEGTLLATSGKGYKTQADCLKVIDTIRNTAPKAKLEDLTKKK